MRVLEVCWQEPEERPEPVGRHWPVKLDCCGQQLCCHCQQCPLVPLAGQVPFYTRAMRLTASLGSGLDFQVCKGPRVIGGMARCPFCRVAWYPEEEDDQQHFWQRRSFPNPILTVWGTTLAFDAIRVMASAGWSGARVAAGAAAAAVVETSPVVLAAGTAGAVAVAGGAFVGHVQAALEVAWPYGKPLNIGRTWRHAWWKPSRTGNDSSWRIRSRLEISDLEWSGFTSL